MASFWSNTCLNQITNDMDYVDIHGRQIRVIISEKTGEILIPINEVRQTGFNIYPRTQYNKPLIDDGELIKELDMYLLDCVKTYMLKNKVIFNETQVLQSIDKCKQALISKQNIDVSLNSSNTFLKNRIIQCNSNGIQVQIKQEDKPSSSFSTQNNLHNHNKRSSGDNHDNSDVLNKSFEPTIGLQSSKENLIESPKLSNSKQQKQYTLRSPNCNKNELLENLDASSSSSEITTVNKTKEKSTAFIDLEKIYSVVVTFVESKKTVAWVQNIANKSLLETIYYKVDEFAKKQSPTIPICGKIYAAFDEDHWYRCKVVKTSPLTVFFIDYGNIVEADEVRPISDDLIKIPQQGIRISFKNDTVEPEEIIEIIPSKRFDDGTYVVQIIKEPIQKQDDPSQQINQHNESKLPYNDDQNSRQQKEYILRSPNGDRDELSVNNVSSSSSEITIVNNTKLKSTAKLDLEKTYSVVVTFVGPKETVAWVQDDNNKSVLEMIYVKVDEEARKQSPVTPIRGKIYAALDEDHWYRCKVVKTSPLTVFFIDYGNIMEVDEVHPISDDLIEIPQQSIRISFKNATIEPKEVIEITPLIRFDDGTYFVRIMKESSQQQNHHNAESTTVYRTKLKCKAVLDILKTYSVLVTFVERIGTIAWVQDIAKKSFLEMINDQVNDEAKRQSATTPIRTKIFAALEKDHWHRCKVLHTSPLAVLFIDYGYIKEVHEVRPISDDLIKIPQQGIRISFKNATVEPEELIEITPLIKFDDGTYFVRIIKEPTQQ